MRLKIAVSLVRFRLWAPLLLQLIFLSHEGRAVKDTLRITAGDYSFLAKLELKNAPKTCAAFISRLPFISECVHVRWSGEAVWMPLGEYSFGVDYENHTSFPAPGQFILYPGGISETEILLAYGGVRFASKVGQLAGNHFLTIIEGQEHVYDLGRATLMKGAQKIVFDWA
jgi:hypothetical protein